MKIDVIRNSDLLQKVDFLSNFFWLCNRICSIVADNIEIYFINKKIQEKVTPEKK